MHPTSVRPLEVPQAGGPPERPRRAQVPRIVRPPEGRAEERRPLVLLAEDHADSRDALCALLEAYGYEVVQAADGRQAVARARERRPDLVLMDLMMPGMDGLQATRELRADPALAGVRIVALTALESARPDVLEAGGDDLVAKPIDVRRLLARIPEWLGR
jgi:CheY-like chemotaxis protein